MARFDIDSIISNRNIDIPFDIDIYRRLFVCLMVTVVFSTGTAQIQLHQIRLMILLLVVIRHTKEKLIDRIEMAIIEMVVITLEWFKVGHLRVGLESLISVLFLTCFYPGRMAFLQ
eukprot:sb/3476651/